MKPPGLRTILLFALATLVAGCATPQPIDRTEPEPIRILHIPNLRLALKTPPTEGFRQDLSHRVLTDLLTEWSTTWRPDFTCFSGNQIENRDPGPEDLEEFLYLADNLAGPWYALTGTREANPEPPENPTTREVWLDRLEQKSWLEEETPWFEATPNPRIKLLNLDTAQTGTAQGTISEAQIDWLKERIARADPNQILIVHVHHPILPPPGHEEKAPENAETVRKLLEESPKVKLVLQGVPSIPNVRKKGGLEYVNSPSPTAPPHTYRWIEIEGPNLRHGLRSWK